MIIPMIRLTKRDSMKFVNKLKILNKEFECRPMKQCKCYKISCFHFSFRETWVFDSAKTPLYVQFTATPNSASRYRFSSTLERNLRTYKTKQFFNPSCNNTGEAFLIVTNYAFEKYFAEKIGKRTSFVNFLLRSYMFTTY